MASWLPILYFFILVLNEMDWVLLVKEDLARKRFCYNLSRTLNLSVQEKIHDYMFIKL